MNHLNNYICGFRIIESPLATERVGPAKTHYLKPKMKLSYHNRIQKKWIKRWGFEYKPCAYRTSQGFICHPSIAEAIRQTIKN